MKPRTIALLLIAASAALLWHAELFTVQRPGERPRDLALLDTTLRGDVQFDAVLPAVPIGMRRLRAGDGPLLIHFWAPWQQDALAQASALDSLRRMPGLEGLRIEVVCFDPFPSVARYIARRRLKLPVLLDTRGVLRRQLPCPSIPFTIVVDGHGQVAVRQPGQVLWLSAPTRETLERVLRAADPSPAGRREPV